MGSIISETGCSVRDGGRGKITGATLQNFKQFFDQHILPDASGNTSRLIAFQQADSIRMPDVHDKAEELRHH